MESPPLEGSLLKTKSGQSQADIFREIFSNSPRSSPTVPVNPVLKTNPTLFSIIEELILTEESYIGGLIYLLVNYLKPLVATRTSGAFIVHTCSLVETLITINQSFLTEIKNYACISEGQTFSDSEPNGITEKVAMLVSDRAVPKLVYTEYISIYERSLKAIKRCNIHADSIKHLGSKKLDMSLISLLQKEKPIARILKYRLLLEGIVRAVPKPLYKIVSQHLESLKCKLREINKECFAEDKSEILFCSFSAVNCNTQVMEKITGRKVRPFPFDLFGPPILCGALSCTWVESNAFLSSRYLGCILFKSHLLIVEPLKGVRNVIKFIIPLAYAKVVSSYNSEGLYLDCDFSFKIIFEEAYGLYEVLFVSLNAKEHHCWLDHLSMLIDVVNGPYALDYAASKSKESSGFKTFVLFPSSMRPLDIHSASKCLGGRGFHGCYFRKLIVVHVEKGGPKKFTIEIKTCDRVRVEDNMKEIWSFGLLPFVSKENSGTVRRTNYSIRRTGSWSHLKSLAIDDSPIKKASSMMGRFFRKTT